MQLIVKNGQKRSKKANTLGFHELVFTVVCIVCPPELLVLRVEW